MASGADDSRRADAARRNNPMNRLVPYLDLFMRLDDAEMSRLAGVEVELVATLRRQVVEISEGLAMYLDLLPRLSDDELVRLTGASAKTVRFWRLCQPKGSPARSTDVAARAEISSITPMPRPAPAAEQTPAQRDEQPTELRRRTTGMSLQATMVQGGASASQSQSQPVANWSHEASSTNAATTITPPPHQLPAAAWDTTSPTSGTETMVTPITQVPAAWGAPLPSETTTSPAAAASSRAPRPATTVDPADSQAAAARTLDINGEPFPGFEWRPATDDDGFSLSELDS